MTEDFDAWWTDLHLHPVRSDWQPAASELPGLLAALGIERLPCCTLFGEADHWDAMTAAPPPLAEGSDCSVAEFCALLTETGAVFASCLLDPATVGLEELAADCRRASRGEWDVCVATLGFGPASIPDLDHEQTLARFAFSLGIAGPGVPPKPQAMARQLPRLPLVAAACLRLQAITGERYQAHLSLSQLPENSAS